jgi:2-oxoglutarate ferredoxin oxidoreductase subunit gamma
MHHDYVEPTLGRIRPGSVVLVNTTLYEAPLDGDGLTRVDVPATALAVEAGNIMVASMVMLGAYAAVTEIVGLESLADAVAASLPSYRTQHIATNTAALRVGFDAVERGLAPAWAQVASA